MVSISFLGMNFLFLTVKTRIFSFYLFRKSTLKNSFISFLYKKLLYSTPKIGGRGACVCPLPLSLRALYYSYTLWDSFQNEHSHGHSLYGKIVTVSILSIIDCQGKGVISAFLLAFPVLHPASVKTRSMLKRNNPLAMLILFVRPIKHEEPKI